MGFDPSEKSAVLVTGIQAAGKSTIGRLLAERFDKGAFVEGDLIWKLIVTGRADMTPNPSPKALEQLHLRYRNGAVLVDSLVGSGFCFAWTGTTDQARERLENSGVSIEEGPVKRFGARGWGESIYFRDPDGSLIELICYR